MKKYKLTKYYNYAEFFIIEANSIEEAKAIPNSIEWDDQPYDTYEEFDFQIIEEIQDGD